MKIVRTAKIEVVKLEQLREGDEILWSNLRCRVVNVDEFKRKVYFVPYSTPGEAFEGYYLNYYRLIDYEEQNICHACGREIEEGEICDICKDEIKRFVIK